LKYCGGQAARTSLISKGWSMSGDAYQCFCFPNTSTLNVPICSSQLPYSFNGKTFTSSHLSDTLLRVNYKGCDSVVTMNIQFLNSASSTNQTICSSQLPYTYLGHVMNSAGKDTLHLTNKFGCDSLAILNLVVKPVSSSITNRNICSALMPYTWNGLTFTTDDSQTAHLTNYVGCDSAATLNLTVVYPSTSVTDTTVCSSQLPLLWNGLTITSFGNYSVTLANSNTTSCDSIAYLNVYINSSATITSLTANNTTICNGSSAIINVAGKTDTLMNAAVDLWYNDILNMPNSSNATLNRIEFTKLNLSDLSTINSLWMSVKLAPLSPTNARMAIYSDNAGKPGTLLVQSNVKNSFTIGINTFNITPLNLVAGNYWVAVLTNNTIILNSKTSASTNNSKYVSRTYSSGLISSITTTPANESFALGLGANVTPLSTSTIQYTWLSVPSLTSITSTTVSVNPTITTKYYVQVNNELGCSKMDSIEIKVNQTTTSITNLNICSNLLPYTWNGKTLSNSGTLIDTLVSYVSCDSIATLNLSVTNATTYYVDADGDGYGNASISQQSCTLPSGYVTNYSDCDDNNNMIWRTGTLYLDMDGDGYDNGSIVTCYGMLPSNYKLTTLGKDCNDNNSASTITPIANAGPDKTICKFDSVQIGASPTSGLVYYWYSTTAISNNRISNPKVNPVSNYTYVLLVTDATGCRSKFDTMFVKVNQLPFVNAGRDTIINLGRKVLLGTTAIAGLTYKWTPTLGLSSSTIAKPLALPTSSTTYVLTVTNTTTTCKNSDAVEIKQKVVTINANICSGSIYTYRGTNYSVAGSYNVHITNYLGFDSLVVLNLNVKPTSSSTTNVTICSTQTPYNWNGLSLNSTGTSMVTFTNYRGCDSIANLNLTVTPASTWYADADADGFGNPAVSQMACSKPNNYVSNNTDCNDNNVSINATQQYYVDTDLDGFGSNTTAMLCSLTAPSGYSTNNTDCNDNNASINSAQQYYVDADLDGFGSNTTAMLCSLTAPSGYSTNNTDCNDNNNTKWRSILIYTDNDVDGITIGNGINTCIGNNAPLGFALIKSGTDDCNDNNALVGAAPVADAGTDKIICLKDSVQIGVIPVMGISYFWYSTTAISNNRISNPKVSPSSNYLYALLAVNSAGCRSKFDTVMIKVNPLPVANAGLDKTINAGQSVQIGTNAISGMSYLWTPNINLSSLTISKPLANPTSTRNYILKVTNNTTGCFKQDTMVINVNVLARLSSAKNEVKSSSMVEKISNQMLFDLTPNPAKDIVRLSFGITETEANLTLILLDLNGQLVREIKLDAPQVNGEINLDLTELNSGVYFLSLHSNNQISTKKLVVQK
ncbi:MAG: hypothetical protein RL065_869, partial [Bacteroidota bacterium]